MSIIATKNDKHYLFFFKNKSKEEILDFIKENFHCINSLEEVTTKLNISCIRQTNHYLNSKLHEKRNGEIHLE